MKVMVTGVKGQLGYDVMRRLAQRGIEAKGVDIEDFDLTDAGAVLAAFDDYRPDAVVHCAAYTAVDRAEEEREACISVNVKGTANVAMAAKAVGAEMMYISTDYVFDGCSKDDPWEAEDEKDPQNVYGYTKHLGEAIVEKALEKYYILRICWVFGVNGDNFVKTMLKLSKNHDAIEVVHDQYGAPTYTYDVADLICEILLSHRYGVYHASNEGEISWCDFAGEIMRQAGADMRIIPVSTEEYQKKHPAAAQRPKNSRMSKRSLDDAGFSRLPHYADALARFLKEYEEWNR